MKNYDMEKIRNIALIGASGSGKTSLAEQMLFDAKAINRVGSVDKGNTVMDFNAEEIEKKMSLTLGVASFDWENCKVNVIDTPGLSDYAYDQIAASLAVETLVFVTSAAAGYEATLEHTLELFQDKKKAKAVLVNRMDNEGADFNKALQLIRENSNINPIALQIPIGSEHKFEGVVDIIKNKAIIDGKETEVPADMKDKVDETRLEIMEAVAESDDELLEKYFDAGELTNEEIIKGLTKAITAGNFVPAFACSVAENIAIKEFMNAVVEYLPSPAEVGKVPVMMGDEEKNMICSPDGELLGYVFKSVSDPNVGDLSYVRIFSGSLKSGMDVYVPEKNAKDRIGSMYYICGKNRTETNVLQAGEIGGLVKMKTARSLCSLVKQNSNLKHVEVEMPKPVYWQSIKAENQSDEDKIGTALAKLLDEDPSIHADMNPETGQNVISGVGEQQLTMLSKKLKSRYKIEAIFDIPKVPYKETLKGKADVSYRHKKQTGGKGQFAEVYFRCAPKGRGEGFEFINSIVGGAIPSKFIPAIEKGLNEILQEGIISGNPIVDISVECYDGSFHEVDSSEMAFKIASWQALKKAFAQAGGILLEPIHKAEIIIPDEYMGDVMGDVSTRRGKILGMEQKGKKQILNAQMPLAELFGYYPALKSLTQGRGKFEQEFSHYEKVPNEIAEKVIAASKKED
ncbi:MAG: elongation factor G [Candidatus Cloacimonadota bacterium]|nr:elongation factor G [Candidatus Cloacimonadota bacterium]